MNELLLKDTPIRSATDEKPLLWKMSELDSNYLDALETFPFKTLISNVKKDLVCPYCTSSITYWNPYKRMKLLRKGNRILGHSGFNQEQERAIFFPLTRDLNMTLVYHFQWMTLVYLKT